MSSTGLQLGRKLKGLERPPLAYSSNDITDKGSRSASSATTMFLDATSTVPRGARRSYTFPGDDAASIRSFFSSADKRQRKHCYEELLYDISKDRVSPELLLNFVRFEPNLKLVQQATRDYLTHRQCAALEEFDGVKKIVELFEQNQLSNTGAVLAGLLSMNDRRINAVLRTLRTRLSLADIREFSRIHPAKLHAASIEFYLDWCLELQQKKKANGLTSSVPR